MYGMLYHLICKKVNIAVVQNKLWIEKNVVPDMDPWGTPELIIGGFEDPSPLSKTC